MIRIGYAPGGYDLFHIGHLNLLRRAREHCEYLIAGVVADEVLIRHKGVTPSARPERRGGAFDLKARTGVRPRKSGGNVSGIVETGNL